MIPRITMISELTQIKKNARRRTVTAVRLRIVIPQHVGFRVISPHTSFLSHLVLFEPVTVQIRMF